MFKRVDTCYIAKQETLQETLFAGNKNIEEIHIGGDIKFIPEGCFYNCINLKKVSIECDLKSIKTAAFMNCVNLEVINIPKSCKKIEDFAFYNCEKLHYVICKKDTIDDIPLNTYNDILLSTERVGGLYYFEIKTKNHKILYVCKNFKEYKNFAKQNNLMEESISIKLSSFGKPSIVGSNELFKNYRYVKNIDISNLDASRFTNCSEMFASCRNLKEIKMPKNGFKNVRYLYRSFFGNNNLEKIDFSSSDLSNIISIKQCFLECFELKIIIPPKNSDFDHLIHADGIFVRCYQLISIDLSNFSFPKLLNIKNAFYGCNNIESIKLPEIKKKVEVQNLFKFCEKLTDLKLCNKIKSIYNCDLKSVMKYCPLEKDVEKYIEIAEE